MTQEAQDQLNEQEIDQEAEFEAGFNETIGEQDDDPSPQSNEAPPAETQQEDEPVIAGLKESELKALLAKAAKYDELEGRVFGKFGEVQRTIMQMQQQGAAGQPITLTADKLKRLHEFDPEFAQAIAEDLSEILRSPVGSGQPAIDPQQYQQAVDERVSQATSQLTQQFEAKLLTMKHPDWQQMAASPDFQMWKSTLDEQTQAELSNSWDASYLASKLDEFKAWHGRANSKQTKQRRLEQAVTPEGVGGMSQGGMTEDDAFLAGFNAMRGT